MTLGIDAAASARGAVGAPNAVSAPNAMRVASAGGSAESVVAVDLGATNLRVALAVGDRLGPAVVHRTSDLPARTPGRRDPDIVPAIAEAVRDAIAGAMHSGLPAPVAVGIGIAAFVDPLGDLIDATPYGVPAGDRLRTGLAHALDLPVTVDNDAKAAALGELERGAGRDVSDFVLVTLGTNIGGAIVHGGRLVRGAHGIAGEVGMILAAAHRGTHGTDATADAGRLGRAVSHAPAGYAYLEELAGGRALAHRAGTTGSVFAAAATGDPHARTVVAEAIEGWSVLVADLAVILDPGLVILSGGLVAEAAHFIEPLRRRVGELTAFAPEIRIGELGASAGLVGAAVAARRVAGTPEARQAERAPTDAPRTSDTARQRDKEGART
jgi:glucokinase